MPSLFLHRISVVLVYLSIVATTQDPAGRDPHHATQACALNGNPTGNPLVCRPVLNPLSHTSHVFPSLSYLELGSYFFNLNFIFLLQFIFNIIFVLVSGVEHSGWTIIYFTKCSP